MFGLGQPIINFFSGLTRWYWRTRLPQWREIGGCDQFTSTEGGEHNILPVSRHSIAESGLKCPNCNMMAAPRGVFRNICRTRLGEAVICGGSTENGVGCSRVLLASPDTEHGDDLLHYEKRVFHKFVRIDEKKAMREAYGEDVDATSPDNITVKGSTKRIRLGDITSQTEEQKQKNRGIPWDEVADRGE